MKHLSFYVPEEYLGRVKESVFSVGAGRLGNYSQCCWEVLGQGQFFPQEGSHPFLGEKGRVEKVKEYKVELLCEDSLLEATIKALKESHPYEEPAYFVLNVEI